MSKVEVKEEYYPSGQVWWREESLNGKYHGLGEGWYYDGQLRWRLNYRNDDYYGLWEWWNKNGELIRREFYMI